MLNILLNLMFLKVILGFRASILVGSYRLIVFRFFYFFLAYVLYPPNWKGEQLPSYAYPLSSSDGIFDDLMSISFF